jgi:hypothetical protein
MDFSLVERHPWMTAGIIGVGALLLYLYWSRSSNSSTSTDTSTSTTYSGGYPVSTAPADNTLALAQISANAQTTQLSAQLQGLQIQTAGQVQIAGMDQTTQLRVAELNAGAHVGDTSAALAAQLATINAQLQLGTGSQQTQVDLAKLQSDVQLASINAIADAYGRAATSAPAQTQPNIIINIPAQQQAVTPTASGTNPSPTAINPAQQQAVTPTASGTNPSPTAINPAPPVSRPCLAGQSFQDNTNCPINPMYPTCPAGTTGTAPNCVTPSTNGSAPTSGVGRGGPSGKTRGVSLAVTTPTMHTTMLDNMVSTMAPATMAAPAPKPIGLQAGGCGFDAACIEANRVYYANAEDQRMIDWCKQNPTADCMSTYGV